MKEIIHDFVTLYIKVDILELIYNYNAGKGNINRLLTLLMVYNIIYSLSTESYRNPSNSYC
jgi:hypothetical protein